MRHVFLFTILAILISITGCGGGSPATNTTNTANTNAATVNTNSPVAVTTPTPEQTTNNAPTLTPVFKAYCDAWVKNDEAALRKTYSSDTLKQFESEMKAEKEKSLLKFLGEEKVSGSLCEVTNEQINGDTATARIRSDKMPNGIRIVFVKEGGEWKITTKSPSVDAVTKIRGKYEYCQIAARRTA